MKFGVRWKIVVGLIAIACCLLLSIVCISYFTRGNSLASPSASDFAKEYAKIHPELKREPAPAKSYNSPIKVVFGSLAMEDKNEEQKILDQVSEIITANKDIQEVNRYSLSRLLENNNLSLAQLSETTNIVKKGQLIPADWLIFGTHQTISKKDFITLHIIDTKSGILQGVTLIELTNNAPNKMASFIQEKFRDVKSQRTSRSLAIGLFENLTFEDEGANIQNEIRSFLVSELSKQNYSILEREHADILLREYYLNLMGLMASKSSSVKNASLPSANWAIDGSYRLQKDGQIELIVQLSRAFGKRSEFQFVGKPDKTLYTKVKNTLIQEIGKETALIIPNPASEARLYEEKGNHYLNFPYLDFYQYTLDSNQLVFIPMQNILRAQQAYETALLLQPTNDRLRFAVASFHVEFGYGTNEMRACCRDILSRNAIDHIYWHARIRLLESFEGWPFQERLQWFQSALTNTSNPQSREFYDEQIKSLRSAVAREQGDQRVPQQFAEMHLKETLSKYQNRGLSVHPDTYTINQSLETFLREYDPDRDYSAKRLVELWPELKQQFAENAPQLNVILLSLTQTNTNNCFYVDLVKTLDILSCSQTNSIFRNKDEEQCFWDIAMIHGYFWAVENKHYSLAAKIALSYLKSRQRPQDLPKLRQAQVALVCATFLNKEWETTLSYLKEMPPSPIKMEQEGPWGNAFWPFLPSKMARLCRQNLGQNPDIDPKEFLFTTNCINVISNANFLPSDQGVWIASKNTLELVDTNFTRIKTVSLPIKECIVSCLEQDATHFWIGTLGSGLLEYNKETGVWSQFLKQNGLALDDVASLLLKDKTLWIGYGLAEHNSPEAGGLGLYDLVQKKFHYYDPSVSILNKIDQQRSVILQPFSHEEVDKPTFQSIVAMGSDSRGNLWLTVLFGDNRIFNPKENTWTASPIEGTCSYLTTPSGRFYITQDSPYNYSQIIGVRWFDSSPKELKTMPTPPELPSLLTTAIAMDGNNVWIGGLGYIALFDPASQKVIKVAYVKTQQVDQLAVCKGCLWARFNKRLFCHPLTQ